MLAKVTAEDNDDAMRLGVGAATFMDTRRMSSNEKSKVDDIMTFLVKRVGDVVGESGRRRKRRKKRRRRGEEEEKKRKRRSRRRSTK